MAMTLPLFVAFFAGLLLGGLLFYLYFRSNASRLKSGYERENAILDERLAAKGQKAADAAAEISALKTQNTTLEKDLTALKIERSTLETVLQKDQKAAAEKLAVLNEARTQLSDAFKALSAEALKSNNQMFLEIARATFDKLREGAASDLSKRQTAIDQMVKPIREGLNQFDLKIQSLEKARVGAYEGLNQQVKSLIESQHQLRSETINLVNALRTPQVRGRWGEIQLKRVVEMAGMLNHCDFKEQPTVSNEDAALRPDMIVNLPGGKTLVVDAKVPLSAYLDGMAVDDETAKRKNQQEHARRIREHIAQLSRKSYWAQFPHAPEFVILFLPGEAFYSAALQEDPSLIEQGVDQRVIIATPTTLIALLKAVAYGWKQETLAENSKKIGDLGKEIYKRIADLSGHFTQLGGNLRKAVESYNRSVGTLESRVLVSARRFEDLKVSEAKEAIRPIPPVEQTTRDLQAPEMIQNHDADC
ncbi:MAG: DNA recombination protein RmuC [Nitrospiria bacterium]